VEQQGGSPSFLDGLRIVWAERDFRKLFATRLVSQGGDGVFNAGFAAYAFFSATTFPDPTAAVYAFAVLYLPYSLIGPFAGVFIDRWSRRQVLVWSALIRGCLVVIAGLVVLAGQTGVPLYISALAVLGVNRFFLSAVSAGTPHVVSRENLVIANAVAPTAGTILGFVGGVAGLGVHLATGGGHAGSAATLLTGGVCYAAAGLLALRMRRDLLGPDETDISDLPMLRAQLAHGGPPAASSSEERSGLADIAADLRVVGRGLIDGLRHLGERRRAAYALGSIGVYRMLYGILLVMGLLLYRNYFYTGGNGNKALGHATLLVITSAIGFGLAAVVTPPAVRRIGKDAWITACLAAGGIAVLALGAEFNQIAFLVLGLVLGLASQGVKICVDTTVQQEVDDAYMGRVFSLYDMLYNVSYVIGPAIAAPFMPATGKSYPVALAITVVFIAAAMAYRLLTSRGGRSETAGEPPAASLKRVDGPSRRLPLHGRREALAGGPAEQLLGGPFLAELALLQAQLEHVTVRLPHQRP
jgi:MFS family permease